MSPGSLNIKTMGLILLLASSISALTQDSTPYVVGCKIYADTVK